MPPADPVPLPPLRPPIDMDAGIGPPGAAPTVSWTNRRKMAWCAFVVLIAGAAVALYVGLKVAATDRQVQFVESIYSYVALTMASVILGYLGFTSLPFFGASKR